MKLYNRTDEEIEEEQSLIDEMKKIEARKREREKKTQDLQKLITAADHSTERSSSVRQRIDPSTPLTQGSRPGRRPGQRKTPGSVQRGSGSKDHLSISPSLSGSIIDSSGIKFPEVKTAGPSLRSSRMKLPASVGQKKGKAIEQLLHELNIDLRPMPTEEIVTHFNELRSDMVLLYELKMALANCEFDLQTLRHQYEALKPDTPLELAVSSSGQSGGQETGSTVPVVAKGLKQVTSGSTAGISASGPSADQVPSADPSPAVDSSTVEVKQETTDQVVIQQQSQGSLSQVLDVSSQIITPNRKRKAALEQGNLLRKLKKDVK